MYWQTSRRKIELDRPIVMGILNVTPDSFSDGGKFVSLDAALRQAEKMIADGSAIIDIGGESSRPGSERVSVQEEIERTAPAIEKIAAEFGIPVSIDTSKSEVAEVAIAAGAEIVNDISGLRFDPHIADVAARHKTGLVLMHSRGDFETMHSQPPVEDIFEEVASDFRRSISAAAKSGVSDESIVLDVGIGFGKTLEQNLELIAKLDKLVSEFDRYPILVGASRKSFIGRILGDVPADQRLNGSLAAAVLSVWNGAKIVRVHDVKETVQSVELVRALLHER